MKIVKTAKIKLDAKVSDLLQTVITHTAAYNFVCETAFNDKNASIKHVQNKTYKEIRKANGLPAQLAISAINKGIESVKGVFASSENPTCPKSKLCSIRYDKHSYTLYTQTNEVSLLTLDGRKRYKFFVPANYKVLFADWEYKSAELCIKNNKVFLHIVFNKEIKDTKPKVAAKNFIGIDRGINNIATTSDNVFYGGDRVKRIVAKNRVIREALQAKGTKSARRHLRKLSGQERRFRADTNHIIAKDLVSRVKPGQTLVLEDLSRIRESRCRKKERRELHNWPFYQLQQFIIYKALAKGIRIVLVNPAYTSKCCSRCGCIRSANRKKHSFICKKCKLKLNADLNAARNIKDLGCYMQSTKAFRIKFVVNKPNVVAILQRSGNAMLATSPSQSLQALLPNFVWQGN